MEDEAVHPRLSTVTYLTSGGAPTVIIEKALPLLPPPPTHARTRTRSHHSERTRRTHAREHTDAQARTQMRASTQAAALSFQQECGCALPQRALPAPHGSGASYVFLAQLL